MNKQVLGDNVKKELSIIPTEMRSANTNLIFSYVICQLFHFPCLTSFCIFLRNAIVNLVLLTSVVSYWVEDQGVIGTVKRW